MKTFFVSSTFRDMQYERDAIREISLPRINRVAKEYGQSVSFCDLRWGVNTLDLDEEQGMRSVLEVCLDQIDRCDPPMIVLIGERYGSIPDPSLIKDAADRKRLVLDDYDISVTSLEVAYGALLTPERLKNTLFYFRTVEDAPEELCAEDELHRRKLAELKEKILSLAGDAVRTYTLSVKDGKLCGAEAFAEMVARDVISHVSTEWERERALTPFERERRLHDRFIEERASAFAGREELLGEIFARIERGETTISLKGEAGCGMSTLFSAAALSLREKGWDVLPFVGGLTTESNDAADILRNTVTYLTRALSMPEEELAGMSVPDLRAKAAELIEQYTAAGHKFMLMVDSVESLLKDENRDTLAFVPEGLGENYRFLATSSDAVSLLGRNSIRIPSLDESSRLAVAHAYLERYGKTLDDETLGEIVRLPSAGSPLYLSFVLMRLLMMNREDFEAIAAHGGDSRAIAARQHEIIRACPTETGAMCSYLLKEAAGRIDPAFIGQVIEYIACSRFGMRESDLGAIMGEKWNTLAFVHFISYMNDCFLMRDDGRIDFTHATIRDGIRKGVDGKAVHARILARMRELPEDDPIRRSELVYHAMGADDVEFFRACLAGAAEDLSNPAKARDLFPMIRDIFEFSAADHGAWISSVIENTPLDRDPTPFLTAMTTISQLLIRTCSNIELAIAISSSLERLSRKMKELGMENADEWAVAFLSAKSVSLFQQDLSDGDGMLQLMEAIEHLEESYDRAPSAETLRLLASLLGVCIPAVSLGTGSVKRKLLQKALFVVREGEKYCEAEATHETVNTLITAYITASNLHLVALDMDRFADAYLHMTKVIKAHFDLVGTAGIMTLYSYFNAVNLVFTETLSKSKQLSMLFGGIDALPDNAAALMDPARMEQVTKMFDMLSKDWMTLCAWMMRVDFPNGKTSYITSLLNRATYSSLTGRDAEETERALRGAIDMLDGTRAEHSVENILLRVQCLNLLANMALQRAEFDEALSYSRRSIALRMDIEQANYGLLGDDSLTGAILPFLTVMLNRSEELMGDPALADETISYLKKFFNVCEKNTAYAQMLGMALYQYYYVGAVLLFDRLDSKETFTREEFEMCIDWTKRAHEFALSAQYLVAASEDLEDNLSVLEDIVKELRKWNRERFGGAVKFPVFHRNEMQRMREGFGNSNALDDFSSDTPDSTDLADFFNNDRK